MKIEVEDIKRISLKDGDTMVVRFKSSATYNGQLRKLGEVFKETFPKNQLLVIPETMEIYKLISEENIDG